MRGGTIGCLVNAGAIVVVDSQFPAEGKVCLDGLNTQSGGRGVDFLINTHHHGDHSAGNVSLRGAAKKVVAQVKAAEHMHNPPGAQPPTDQLFPATTFTETWAADVGDERVSARHYGRAHTSGDAVITFVDSHMKAGRTRDEILAMRDPLKGFESYGRFGQANPRDILTCAHEEITTGQ